MNSLAPIENNGQRVLTTAQLAEAYGTNNDVITKNFSRNIERYSESKHFYCLTGEDLRNFRANGQIDGLPSNLNKLYLWTEKGALLHAKSLNTDKAWEVYDSLVENYFNKKVNELDGISTELKAIIMQDKKIQAVENRVDKLENTMTIDYGQQQTLTEQACKTAVSVLGGKNSNAYKTMSKKVFSAIHNDFRNHFNVNSNKNTPSMRFQEALLYYAEWQPDNNLRLEIANTNRTCK